VALEDWLDTARAVATAWGGQSSRDFQWSGPQQFASPAPPQFPQGVSAGNDLTQVRGLGCKRRKRQRNILTQANIGIMWQISSLPNNANVRIALARAIR